jgi:hypothetical protein
MKYKTFRNLVAAGGGLLLLGVLALCGLSARYLANMPSENRPAAQPSGTPAPTPVSQAADPSLRRVDQLVLELLTKRSNATGDKIKDAFPREPFKVNVYRDGTSPTWTRLKIDLDRDNRDDEKWTLSNGQMDKRQVSTRDDEQYDREYRWRNGKWVEKN